MKTLKNYEIIKYINELNKYADKKLPQKISYAITRNFMKLEAEYSIYVKELEKLIGSYDEHIDKDENGENKSYENGLPVITEESYKDDFIKEFDELINLEVEVDLYLVPEEVFDYDDNAEKYDLLSPAELSVLMSILCQ